jgi:hypothetical protein
MPHLIRQHEKLGRTLTQEETVTSLCSLEFEISEIEVMRGASRLLSQLKERKRHLGLGIEDLFLHQGVHDGKKCRFGENIRARPRTGFDKFYFLRDTPANLDTVCSMNR